jgi:heptosyltransferase-2
MKILIIGPSWVGDMVMSQSLYITLKQHNPDAVIDVLAPAWCKPILERMPQIHRAIDMPIGHRSLDLKGRWRIGRELAKQHYTHAYILPNSAKSALIPLFAQIAKRIGWKGEFRYGLLNDLRPDKRVFQYMVERYVALAYSGTRMRQQVSLETCPQPALKVDLENLAAVRQKLSLTESRTIVGMCPGAEFGPAKRWPDRYYAQVAQTLIDAGNQVWLFGSSKDSNTTQAIAMALTTDAQQHCFDLSGKTSLNEAVDLLSACDTVISNDSGLMHIAAAVNCNIVAIYGSTSPSYTPPLSSQVAVVHNDVDCRPCFKRECPLGHMDCLNQLPPSQVLNHCQHLFGE